MAATYRVSISSGNIRMPVPYDMYLLIIGANQSYQRIVISESGDNNLLTPAASRRHRRSGNVAA